MSFNRHFHIISAVWFQLAHPHWLIVTVCFDIRCNYSHLNNEGKSKGTSYQTRKPRGDRGIALQSLDLGARRSAWSAPRPGRFTPGKDSVPIVKEAGWAPEPDWTCAKNLASIGIWSLDLPAPSQSLFRLSYPGREDTEDVFVLGLMTR
jgi:hypothetical protein